MILVAELGKELSLIFSGVGQYVLTACLQHSDTFQDVSEFMLKFVDQLEVLLLLLFQIAFIQFQDIQKMLLAFASLRACQEGFSQNIKEEADKAGIDWSWNSKNGRMMQMWSSDFSAWTAPKSPLSRLYK